MLVAVVSPVAHEVELSVKRAFGIPVARDSRMGDIRQRGMRACLFYDNGDDTGRYGKGAAVATLNTTETDSVIYRHTVFVRRTFDRMIRTLRCVSSHIPRWDNSANVQRAGAPSSSCQQYRNGLGRAFRNRISAPRLVSNGVPDILSQASVSTRVTVPRDDSWTPTFIFFPANLRCRVKQMGQRCSRGANVRRSGALPG